MREFFFVVVVFAFILAALTFSGKNKVADRTTDIIVKNEYSDTVDVWLTIGAPSKFWISDVYKVFGIKTHGLKGSFQLAPGDSVIYRPGKAIQGNLCFITDSYQCLNDSTNGTTIVEFCLNNYNKKLPMSQETVEISCVSGVSFIAAIDLRGGRGIWTANHTDYDTIRHIQNGMIGQNSGRAGVYPYGCDDCISQSSEAPACTISKNELPQKYPICNVQRNSALSGGTVTFTFIEPVN